MRGRRRVAGHPFSLGAAAFAGGVVMGLLAWSAMMERCQRDLFCPSPLRRLAALGYLGGRPGAETVRLLSDYVTWERHPMLRRRAHRLLHKLSSHSLD